MRLVLITVLAVAAMSTSVLYASHVQRTTAELHGQELSLTQDIMADANRAEATAATHALTGDPEPLADNTLAFERLTRHLQAAVALTADDPLEKSAVEEQRRLVAALSAQVHSALRQPTAARRTAALRAGSAARHALVDRVAIANDTLRTRQSVLGRREDRHAALVPPLLIVLLSLVFGGGAAGAMRRTRRADRRDAENRALQERFGEAMQVSDSQAEAHTLIKSHLERSIPGATITVLNRNNSADRLEASTGLGDSDLADTLQHARPRSCMAVRLSRPYSHGEASDEVMSCEVCGKLPSDTVCQPLLVGGEVIGSVLTEHNRPLAADDHERIAQSVAQSAPVLANLRNLAIAETRAATDALTGLPNRRAVDDTLLRMLAQAGRSFTPMAAILLDLDHFKEINDNLGHDRGDEVLAAFSTRLREVMRASDFAGRSGGEEFVLFLPDTDRTGAVRLAEKVRTTMKGLSTPGLGRDVTASFGVACFPDDAVDASTLMRCADRALYAAKRGGRDRIEASSTGAPPTEAEQSPTADW